MNNNRKIAYRNNSTQSSNANRTAHEGHVMLIGLILLVTALLAVLGTTFFMRLGKGGSSDNSNKSSTTVKESENATEQSVQSNRLFMQYNSKIGAYNTSTRTYSVLTSTVPNGATVLDLYYSSDNDWRYYATTSDVTGESIYYADQSTQPEIINNIKVTKNYGIQDIVTNAQTKAYSYSVTGPFWEKNHTTKTYLSSNNKTPTIVNESAQYSKEPGTGIGSYLFVVTDISPSGDKLLFQKRACFNCGGGYTSNVFVLNLSDKTTDIINTSDDTASSAYFSSNSIVELDTGQFSLGWMQSNKTDVTSYRFENDQRTKLFSINGIKDGSSESYSIDHNANYALTRLMPDDSTLMPGKLYDITQSSPVQLKTDLGKYESEAPYQYHLGKSSNDCVSAYFYDRDVPKNNSDKSLGVICKGKDNAYKYERVFEDVTEYNKSYDPNYIMQLLY